jgi:hypothetical protein
MHADSQIGSFSSLAQIRSSSIPQAFISTVQLFYIHESKYWNFEQVGLRELDIDWYTLSYLRLASSTTDHVPFFLALVIWP